MKPPAASEAQLQLSIRNYLAALGIDAVHVPNGSHLAGDILARSKQANALKRAGVMPGFPDLICFDRRARRVCLLEVKAKGGKLQPSQEAFAAHYVPAWGWPYAVVRSIDDTRAALSEWGWR